MKDYYQILQVQPNASQDEIKRAYRRLAKLYHPDVASEAGAAVFIQELNEAYKTLSHPEMRARYDWMRTNQSETVILETVEAQYRSQRRPPPFAAYQKRYNEREMVRPYLKYAYAISRASLLFCLLLALDFLLPMERHADQAVYLIKMYAEENGFREHEHTQLQTQRGHTFVISKEAGAYFEQSRDLLLYHTALLGKVRYVASAATREEKFSINSSIYGNFIFFPLVLLVCAALGSLKRFSPEVDFSFGIVSAVLLIISVGLLLV